MVLGGRWQAVALGRLGLGRCRDARRGPRKMRVGDVRQLKPPQWKLVIIVREKK